MSEFSNDLSADLEREGLRQALRDAHRQLAKSKNKADLFAEAAYEGARDAMLTLGVPKLILPPDFHGTERRGRPEAALWHLTDWQGAKRTASYDSQVMRDRVHKFVDKAASITAIQRADHDVPDCIVVFSGDMIEGLFNFPQQPFEIDATLFEQYEEVAVLEAEVVRAALSMYENVTVIAEWGNHGRVGSKRSAVPKSDNFDRMTYRLAKAILGEQPRLIWQDCPEDIQRLEYGNYRALVIHGDEVGRNGFASPMTIVAHANRWRSGAYRWAFRDVYMGHYHTHAEWPLANGEGHVYQTGSTESDNRFARDNMASSAIPSQRLHFIDPRKGRVTAQYQVYLAEPEAFDITNETSDK